MKRLRLLALTTSYPLREQAAAGVFVRRLYENLPEAWEVTVLCPDDVEGAGRRRTTAVDVIPVRYAPRRWQVLSQNAGGIVAAIRESRLRLLLVPLLAGAMLLRALRSARAADLLHANWSMCGAIAVIAGKLVGRPVVTTFRGDDIAKAEWSLFMRALLWMCVRGSKAVTCVSEPMAEELKRRYPRHVDRISVCLNGVDRSFLAVDRPSQDSERLRLVAVGSLVHRKGYDILLDAVARMRHRDRVTLRIAGEGPERERLVSQVSALGLGEQVSLIGELPPERIPGFLAEGDVFVLSSRSEGRPNVILEALAAGLPVVCTVLPGVADLVTAGENGWLVPVDDAEAMSLSLHTAHADPGLRNRMGEQARRTICKSSCDWTATGRRYDEIFRACINPAHEVSG